MSTDAIDALAAWVGRTEARQDWVTVPLAERLSATLDRDDPPPCPGDVLPTGWHATLFPRIARRSGVGRDGHPKLGDFLPPVPLPRRMFAGRRTQFLADLRLGDAVKCTSLIASITPKSGRSGKMIFVTVRHSIESARGLAIIEDQDIVYREETPSAPASTNASPAPAVPQSATWTRAHVADEVTLFRYSALTFNGHRIHYDFPYVTGVEGYPGLVMNGGLTTLYLYELLRTCAPRPLATMSTRNLKPLFAHQKFNVCAEPAADGNGAKLWVVRENGDQILDGSCEFKAG